MPPRGDCPGIAGCAHRSAVARTAQSPNPMRGGSHDPSLMALSLPLLAAGGAVVGALVGLLIGLDARSNGWSRQSFALFMLVGAVAVPPALFVIMRFAGVR